MTSCFEDLSCIWFDRGDGYGSPKRNAISSILSGVLVFIGWWIIIDANSTHPNSFSGAYHICGIVGTLSFIMVNAIGSSLYEDYSDLHSTGGCVGMRGARFILFCGFVLGFAAVISACWILFAVFAISDVKSKDHVSSYVGVALLLQNAFIFAGSMVFKFGRTDDSSAF